MTRVCLETSLFGFGYDDRAPARRDAVGRLFRGVRDRDLQGFTSATTIAELGRSRANLAEQLLSLVTDHGIAVFPDTPEVISLARAYLAAGIVPEEVPEDATHLAAGVLDRADDIATLNLEHMARAWVVERIHILSRARGLPPVPVVTPEKVP